MLKNKLAILLAIVLLISLVPVNSVLAAQDYNSSRSNKPSPVTEGEQEDDIITSELDESVFQLRLRIGDENARIGEIEKKLDVAPFIENGRTMVPFRFIGEELGAEISWEPIQKRVSYKLKDIEVELWIDKNRASVNGVEVLVDSENLLIIPRIKDGRTFVPIRFIVEALGFDVEWIEDSKEVVVGAQDYNSSRSNKPSPVSAEVIIGDGSGFEGDVEEEVGAQDYNSSRSNKPSPIAAEDIIGDGKDSEEEEEAKAQDYNSSRSNKPAPSAIRDDDSDKDIDVKISWIEKESKAVYSFGKTVVEILVEKKMALVNGVEIKFNGKERTIIPTQKDDSILGLIRFTSQVSDYTIEWDPKTKELSVKQN